MKKFIHNGEVKNDLKRGFKFVKCSKLSKRKMPQESVLY